MNLAGHAFVRVTPEGPAALRDVQALIEGEPGTWALLEGGPPRPDEARELAEDRPDGVPLERKHLWVSAGTCVLDVLEGFPDATTWYLGLILVAPAARRAGLGTRLIQALSAHVRAQGGTALRLSVVVENAAARRLYDRLGFTLVARRSRETWNHVHQDVDVLELTLPA